MEAVIDPGEALALFDSRFDLLFEYLTRVRLWAAGRSTRAAEAAERR